MVWLYSQCLNGSISLRRANGNHYGKKVRKYVWIGAGLCTLLAHKMRFSFLQEKPLAKSTTNTLASAMSAPRPAKPLMSDDLSISGFASCGLRKSSLTNPSSILDVDCVRIVSSATMLGGAYFELYPSTGGAHLLANHGAILTTDGDATLVRIKKRSDI